MSEHSNPNTTTTSNTNTGATRPLQYGQTFSPLGLIYTTTDASGEGWFCDSRRQHAPIAQVPLHHPLYLDDHQAKLQQLGRVRWTETSIQLFTAGTEVSPFDVLQRVHEHIATYFIADDEVRWLLAAYVLLTYVFTAAETVPYLHLIGEPATGKSLVGDLLQGLAFNARLAATISAPAVYRLLHATTGTLIIDEQGAGNRSWGTVLRAGYRRSGTVTICEGDTPVERRCFGPKVLLTNEPLPDSALASRCISIPLRPVARGTKRYSAIAVAEREATLRDDLHVFGLGHGPSVARAYRDQTELPGLAHREADLAAPLIAVAEVVDRSAPGRSNLAGQVIGLLQTSAARRLADHRVDGEKGALARAINRFITRGSESKSHAYSWRGDLDWYLASDFTEFLNKSGELNRPMSPREVGERLSRFELALARQVIDVRPEIGPLDRHAPRVQRVAYRFNVAKVAESTGRLP